MGDTLLLTTNVIASSTAGNPGNGELVSIISHLIDRLNSHGDRLQLGSEDARLLAERVLHAAIEAEQEIDDLQSRIDRLQRLAVTDELTGVLNRRGFEEEVSRTLSAARRYGEEGMLVYLDLDGFKEINDTLGHSAGDAALRRVGDLLNANVRLTDCVGRLGGDEFAVLLKRTNWQNGVRRARELGSLLDPAVVEFDGSRIEIRASIGLQGYHPQVEGDGAALIARADKAMFEHKRQRGRERGIRRIA